MRKLFILLIFNLTLLSCQSDETVINGPVESESIAENVVIVVIDGPRFQETWGDNNHENIPVQSALLKEGVLFRNFYNEGNTYTLSGHVAITTGYYEDVVNNGSELPKHHSIFQSYLAHTQLPPEEAWLITSKEKLDALADTKNLDWRGSYLPAQSVEERQDSVTIEVALEILDKYTPSLSMIHFKGPDEYGHKNDWPSYVDAIKETDIYVGEIWEFIQSHPHYKDKTAFFITNDHGRHLNGISTGFKDHGDMCEGCKHISLLAFGPDFQDGTIVDEVYGQTDISSTVAAILGFPWNGEGEVIKDLIK